jgi:SAM-dependent methyltransferase
MTARYDGQTEWYEAYTAGEVFSTLRAFAVEQLGPGPGRCLELGCGAGHAIAALVESGWSVVATDVSADQIAAARRNAGSLAEIVQADAHALPFEDGAFDAVVSILTHTDFDDPPRVFTEARRVLREGGTFVYVGIHPCFGSPFVDRADPAAPVLRPGYTQPGWQRLPPDPAAAGVRSRVGVNHIPLAGLLNAIVGSGFTIAHVEEPGDGDPPLFLAISSVGGTWHVP